MKTMTENDLKKIALKNGGHSLRFALVHPAKMILLSILTLGLYQMIWVYRSWWFLRLFYGMKLYPLFGALFNFCWPYLFLTIVKVARAHKYSFDFSPVLFVLAWVGLSFLSQLASPWNVLVGLSLLPFAAFIPCYNFVVAKTLKMDLEVKQRLEKWEIILVLCSLPFQFALLSSAANKYFWQNFPHP
jgi:hypothetical protein